MNLSRLDLKGCELILLLKWFYFYGLSLFFTMKIRVAVTGDITQMQLVRNLVKENRLSNPSLVTDKDVEEFITRKGKGWVCEIKGRIAGFAIADLKGKNIWALFVHPEFEKQEIGKQLHEVMMSWYFSQTDETVWLGTAPATRAEQFYRKAGWKETGVLANAEIKFEMAKDEWMRLQANNI